ncbi:MAG: D-alanyl-D-alanine carboxypeptidase [Clostridia bacterium]|nr:D-alanyl-D-alanine carboxypeptidase [Clostridia bacterium]
MKSRKKLRETITLVVRCTFFITFAVLAIYGVLPKNHTKTYIPKMSGSPVFSHTIQASSTEGIQNGDSIYVFGNAENHPSIGAVAAAVLSADTGEALYLKNADKILPMASTTKIMTALVAIENLSPDTVFTVPAEVCGVEGSSIYLVPGEKITIKDLLYGLLLESGNDAACAIAVACSGSIEDFVTLMNKRASEMGLVNTRFENPHGLSSENHRTTALELSKIAYHAMKNPLFREIVGTKNHIVTDENNQPVKYFSNHNRLLRSYPGATGIKTGYTIASGRCLVTSALRDGTEFIVVTLDDRTDFRDHASMLDFAFDNYSVIQLFEEGGFSGTFGGVKMENSEPITVLKEKNDTSPVDLHFTAE